MVTDVPPVPEVGEIVITGAVVSVKVIPLLVRPSTTTVTGPVLALAGTGTAILALPQLVGAATTPLNKTALVPCVAPKLFPVIVMGLPGTPDVEDSPIMLGATTTVNGEPLLRIPPTVTTTLPVVAPAGTVATIEFAFQLAIDVAFVPLNVSVLVPCVEPKPIPMTATELPTAPTEGDTYAMLRGPTTRTRFVSPT
jgi:hypothetical protein